VKLDAGDRQDIAEAQVIFAGADEITPGSVLVYGGQLWRDIKRGKESGDVPMLHLPWDGTKEQLAEIIVAVEEIKGPE
jgi:hypothetical protein